MSTLHIYVLVCDGPECTARFSRDLLRADQTRLVAQGEGWTHGLVTPGFSRGPSRSLDYCPTHAALVEGLRPKTLPAHACPIDALSEEPT